MNDETENMASHWHDSEIFKQKKKDTLVERIKESPLNHGYDGKKHYPSYPILNSGSPYLVKVQDPAVEELRKELKEDKKKQQQMTAKKDSSNYNEMKEKKEMDKVERKTKKVVTISEPSDKQPPAISMKANDQVLPNQIKNADLSATFNKKEWSGAIKKVAERLFEDPTIPEREPVLSHRPDSNGRNETVDTSMVDQLNYAERLQVMIMQVREDTAVAERKIRDAERKEKNNGVLSRVAEEKGTGIETDEKEMNTSDESGQVEDPVQEMSQVEYSPKQEETVDTNQGMNDSQQGKCKENVSIYSQDPDQF